MLHCSFNRAQLGTTLLAKPHALRDRCGKLVTMTSSKSGLKLGGVHRHSGVGIDEESFAPADADNPIGAKPKWHSYRMQ